MKLSKDKIALLIVVAAAVIAFWIVYSSEREYPLVLSNTASKGPVVEARTNPELGEYQNYLADPNGFALYTHLNECSGQCLKNWIPYLVNPDISMDTLSPDLTTKINTAQSYDEAGNPTYRQYTYLGNPLFYYKGDRNAGDVNGHGVSDGNWVVVLLHAIKGPLDTQ